MKLERSERVYYLVLGALTLLLASAPYLYAYATTPPGHVFTGLIDNIDDSCVYLSWMQQAEAGHFFLHNLFSTDPQRGVLFNLFFWLLGTIVRFTHLPQIAVYQGARVVCGGLFLAAVVGLIRETLPDEADGRGRRLGFALVCLSAGLGWLWGGYSLAHPMRQPIDLWQPEAVSFLSLYFSPLFCAALALMVVFMTAVVRVERTRRLPDAVPAMLAGALLGNFHSYDVIPLFAVWFAFRLVLDSRARRFDVSAWVRFVAVGLAALPTTAYVAWAIRVEPVFYKRAFVSATLSPALRWDLLGLGLPLLLAVVGGVIWIRRGKDRASVDATGNATLYLLTYLVVGIAVAYVPVAFQRKLLMGVQVPICLLAGSGLAALTARLTGDFPKIAAAFVVALTMPSNALFILADMDRLTQNAAKTSHRPYLTQGEEEALNWLHDHVPEGQGAQGRQGAAVLVSPDASSQLRYPGSPLQPYLSIYVPALAGRLVYDGHWSETADYGKKLNQAWSFFRADTPDAYRLQLIGEGGIGYVLCDNRLIAGESPRYASGQAVELKEGEPYVPVAWVKQGPPAYLKTEFQNADVTIYSVNRLAGTTP